MCAARVHVCLTRVGQVCRHLRVELSKMPEVMLWGPVNGGTNTAESIEDTARGLARLTGEVHVHFAGMPHGLCRNKPEYGTNTALWRCFARGGGL